MRQEPCAIPVAANIWLAGGYGAVNLYQFFILPLWLLPANPLWAWSLLPLTLLSNPFWSLIHEAIHDLFHPERKVNLIVGRTLSILFGSPFRILRLSHLLHHKLNRTPIEATEVYESAKGSFPAIAVGYYFQILGGLYLLEFVSPALFLVPRVWLQRIKDRWVKPESVSGILLKSWTQGAATREIRIDGLGVYLCFGLSLFCYGADWPLLIALLAARAFLISFLDNVYHYRTPIDDIFYADNLRLPKPIAGALLNFNLHGIHHKNPAVPWRSLPRLFRQQAQIFHGDYFIAAARQLRGPVALEDLPWAR